MEMILAALSLILCVSVLADIKTKDGQNLFTRLEVWYQTLPKWKVRTIAVICFVMTAMVAYPLASNITTALMERMETMIEETDYPVE